VHWGTSDDEVLEWLSDKWAITGPVADNLIAEAHREKRKAMKGKALQTLGISAACFVVAAIYIGFQQAKGTLEMGGITVAAALIGVVSLVLLLKSLVHVMRGEGEGPAD
jgi:hypothetical protein